MIFLIYLFRNFDILNKILKTKSYFEMLQIEEFFKFCNNKRLINKRIFKKRNAPKISIITPVYNKESTII